MPAGIRTSPRINSPGRNRSITMPTYGLLEPLWPKMATTQKPISTNADAVVSAPPIRLIQLFPKKRIGRRLFSNLLN